MCSCAYADTTFSYPVHCVRQPGHKIYSQVLVVDKAADVQLSATMGPSVWLWHCRCKSEVIVKEF